MKPLTSPRARRPLKARVIAVPVKAASPSASLCTAGAPLSGHRSRAVPTWAAAAPARTTAATAAPVMIPPAAMSGIDTSARIALTSARRPHPVSGATSSSKELWWPPASMPCAHRASAPHAAAATASAGVVTVTTTHDPTPCRAATRSGGGAPKVKLTTGTGRRVSNSALWGQWSSSHEGTRSTPDASASGRTLSR